MIRLEREVLAAVVTGVSEVGFEAVAAGASPEAVE